MKTRRGDVVLVLFPNSDLRTAKRRPALVIQRDELSSGLAQTIVAMISSNLAHRARIAAMPAAFLSAAIRRKARLRIEIGFHNYNRQSRHSFRGGNEFHSRPSAGYGNRGRSFETHAGSGLKRVRELTAKFPLPY
jgi:mRNA-degrading endonuclease toxin of MazEF toxin-antitoxin module